MKRSKRFAALFVALCMVFSTFAFALNVYAATSDEYISGSYRGTGLSLSLNGSEGTAPITTTLNSDGTFDIASGNELVLTNTSDTYDYKIEDFVAEKAYYSTDSGASIIDNHSQYKGQILTAGDSWTIPIEDLGNEFYTDYDRGYAFQVAYRDADSRLLGNWEYDVAYVDVVGYFDLTGSVEATQSIYVGSRVRSSYNYFGADATLQGAVAGLNSGTFTATSATTALTGADVWQEATVYYDTALYPNGFGEGSGQMRLALQTTRTHSDNVHYIRGISTTVLDGFNFYFDDITRYDGSNVWDEGLDTTASIGSNGTLTYTLDNPAEGLFGSIGNPVAEYITSEGENGSNPFRMGANGSTNEVVFNSSMVPTQDFRMLIQAAVQGASGSALLSSYPAHTRVFNWYVDFIVYDSSALTDIYNQYNDMQDPMGYQQDGTYLEYLKALAVVEYYLNGAAPETLIEAEFSAAGSALSTVASELSSKAVDRSAMYDAIDRVVSTLSLEGNCTSDSWTAFLNELDSIFVPSIENGGQSEVDTATARILAAFDLIEFNDFVYGYYDAVLDAVALALQDGGYCYTDESYDAFIEAVYDFIRQDDDLAAELQTLLDAGNGVQYVKDRAIIVRDAEDSDYDPNAHIFALVEGVLVAYDNDLLEMNFVIQELVDCLSNLEYFDFADAAHLDALYAKLDDAAVEIEFYGYWLITVNYEIYDNRYSYVWQEVYDTSNVSEWPDIGGDGEWTYNTMLEILAYYRMTNADMDATIQKIDDMQNATQWEDYQAFYFADGRWTPNGDLNQAMIDLVDLLDETIASVDSGSNEFTAESYAAFLNAYNSYDGEFPINIYPETLPGGAAVTGDGATSDSSAWRRYGPTEVANAMEHLMAAYEQLISTAYAEYDALYNEAMELLERQYYYLDDAFADFEAAIVLIAAPDESLSKSSYALLGTEIDALKDAIDTLKASSFQFGDYKAFYELYQKAEYIANVNAYDYTDDSYVEYVDAFDAWVEEAEIQEWLQNPAEINDGVTLNMRRDEATVNGYISTLESLMKLLEEYPFGDLSRLDVLLIAASEAVSDEEIYTDDSFESFLALYFETLLEMDELPEEVNDGEDPDSRIDEDLVDELEIQLIRALEQLELRQLSESPGGDSDDDGEGKVSTGDTSLLMVYVACSVAIAAIGLVLITKKKRNLDR